MLHESAKDESLVVHDGSYTPEIFEPDILTSDRPVKSDTPSPGEAGGGRDVSISRKRRVEFSEGLPSDDGMVIDKDPDGDTVVIESSTAPKAACHVVLREILMFQRMQNSKCLNQVRESVLWRMNMES